MDFVLGLVSIVAVGCGTAVTLTLSHQIFELRRRRLASELLLEKERRQMRELRITEMERDYEKIRKELEWYQRLLETELSDHARVALGPGARR